MLSCRLGGRNFPSTLLRYADRSENWHEVCTDEWEKSPQKLDDMYLWKRPRKTE